jgi:hypothetical protein
MKKETIDSITSLLLDKIDDEPFLAAELLLPDGKNPYEIISVWYEWQDFLKGIKEESDGQRTD